MTVALHDASVGSSVIGRGDTNGMVSALTSALTSATNIAMNTSTKLQYTDPYETNWMKNLKFVSDTMPPTLNEGQV